MAIAPSSFNSANCSPSRFLVSYAWANASGEPLVPMVNKASPAMRTLLLLLGPLRSALAGPAPPPCAMGTPMNCFVVVARKLIRVTVRAGKNRRWSRRKQGEIGSNYGAQVRITHGARGWFFSAVTLLLHVHGKASEALGACAHEPYRCRCAQFRATVCEGKAKTMEHTCKTRLC